MSLIKKVTVKKCGQVVLYSMTTKSGATQKEGKKKYVFSEIHNGINITNQHYLRNLLLTKMPKSPVLLVNH